jgi:hypothetical protein
MSQAYPAIVFPNDYSKEKERKPLSKLQKMDKASTLRFFLKYHLQFQRATVSLDFRNEHSNNQTKFQHHSLFKLGNSILRIIPWKTSLF